jgi:hypothetical protein
MIRQMEHVHTAEMVNRWKISRDNLKDLSIDGRIILK